jgi:hypothetical protein
MEVNSQTTMADLPDETQQDTGLRFWDYEEWLLNMPHEGELTQDLRIEYEERRFGLPFARRNRDIDEYYAWNAGAKLTPPPIAALLRRS